MTEEPSGGSVVDIAARLLLARTPAMRLSDDTTTDAAARLGLLRALTLKERARLRAEAGAAADETALSDRAQRALERWRAEPAFADAIELEDRLAIDGLDLGSFGAILDEPAEAAAERATEPPAWLTALESAYEDTAALDESVPATAAPGRPALVRFLDAVRPVTQASRLRLRARLERLAVEGPSFDPEQLEGLLAGALDDRALRMVGRTFALELQVASLRGELAGATAEERFASFADRLNDRGAVLDLLEEYPVLGRGLVEAAARWEHVNGELVERLVADWPEVVAEIFGGRDPGALTCVDAGAGDVHRGGRAVRVLTFASGAQLVYKPRALAADRHFMELLAWLDARGEHPPFRRLRLVDRGDYGWSEFAAAEPCASVEEVARYYTRLGGQLALLYALEAIDFHQGNVIAAGEQPVLPDVEALFQPRVGGLDLRRADDVAWATVDHSVLRVGLLPQWLSDGDTPVDLSGIGTTAGHVSPHRVAYWEGAGTDALQLARRHVPLRAADNRPTIEGTAVDVSRFGDCVVDGFTRVYRLLLTHRDELLRDGGPIASFANDELRMLLRPTVTYAALYRESFHPDVLRDALDRDRLFDRLWSVAASGRPQLTSVVSSERADLLRGDIPLFTTRASSRDLWDSDGRRIPDFFDTTGLAQVRRRLDRLGEEDLSRQIWFIRASLSTLTPHDGTRAMSTRKTSGSVEPASPERLVASARAVGDRLEQLALRGEGDVSWIGLSMLGRGRWSLMPLGLDLYDGLPGVALFLAHLGALTGEERYSELARGAVETLRRTSALSESSMRSVGAFDGWGGVVYGLTGLGALWQDTGMLAEATELASRVRELVDEDAEFDVLSGSAGAIAVLLGLHAVAPSQAVLDAAVHAGDHVLAGAARLPVGIGWAKEAAAGRVLSGFSHGVAGVAWSLLRLFAATGAARFADAARAAIEHERTLFSPEHDNWRDLRPQLDGGTHFQSCWCHGAMGIGLARLDTLRVLDDDVVRAEIATALRTTLRQGLPDSHCLCHGGLGNLELLLETGRQPELDDFAARILDDGDRHGWQCGTSRGIESPGLMTGLAGVGYGLLRLADPDRVPSVLLLEPYAPAGPAPTA